MTEHLIKIFSEIVYIAVVSSILIVLILLIKKIFGKVLSLKWHYYIWVLLLIRLIIPFTPESSLSVMNLFNIASKQFNLPVNEIRALTKDYTKNVNVEGTNLHKTPVIHRGTDNLDNEVRSTTNTGEVNNKDSFFNSRLVLITLSYAWLAGMILLTIYTIYINITFAINIKNNYRRSHNPRFENILNECRHIVGIERTIPLVTTKRGRTPSLYTSFYTVILISEANLNRLSDKEIKYIFLHELTHYKRKDIVVNWILTILQILYFFHPLIWFAFYKIHEDCEISCDAEALTYLKEEEYEDYARTIIKLIKLFSESSFIPATAGLWKHKSIYKRRILMISKFKKSNWVSSLLTIILIFFVGLMGLTGCKNSDIAKNSDNSPEVSETSKDTKNNKSTTITDTPAAETKEPKITETIAPASSEEQDSNNLANLAGMLGVNKEKLISKLGEEYNKVDEGGLEFKQQGIRVWFNEKGITNQVFTDKPEIDFKGAKIGDDINNFSEVFGKPISDSDGNALYKVDNYYLSVYYDTKTKITFAVYVLSEEVAVPVKGNE